MILKTCNFSKITRKKCCTASKKVSFEGSIKSYLTPTGHLDLKFRACLDIQATTECGFTLKRVRDMTRTYSQKLFTSNDDQILRVQIYKKHFSPKLLNFPK